MGRRFGQLAGILAFAIMLGRLGRLLLTGNEEPQWNLILAASAFLGGIAWWLLGQMTVRRRLKLTIFIGAGLLLFFRIIAPATLGAGILPRGETLGVLGEQLSTAFRIVQSGVPPVSINEGLLGILAAVMWALGALYTWGSTGGPYAAMFLPPIVMYLQFAVFDRFQAGLGWLMASAFVLALSIISLGMERRAETGRARDPEGRPMGRRSLNLAAIIAVIVAIGATTVANGAASVIDEYGHAPWRGGGSGGYGDGIGGLSYDRLVDLQQRVLNQSEQPVFEATLGPGAPPANQIYWRMETLDVFDGETWHRSDTGLTRFDPGRPLANQWDVYQGPTHDFVQAITIRALRSPVAPTAGVAVDIMSPPSQSNARHPTEFQALSDSALVAFPDLGEDDTYQVRTLHADRNRDLGALATGADGQLTPMFAAAAAAGEFDFSPGSASAATPPPNLDVLTQLPENTPVGIARTARLETAGAVSDFERAWILQSFFRDSGDFIYSTEVSTGHDSLVLENWINDFTSPNYRTGYCEQFAAAMAVMARSLGIPSRVVWGFTPGTQETQGDGTEKVVVRDRNAHAWVELWVEPYGWVQFDPTPRAEQDGFAEQPTSLTAGLDPDDYIVAADPSDILTAPDANPGFVEDTPVLNTESDPLATGPRWWLIGLVALLPVLAVIPVSKRLRRRRRLARIRQGDITAAWDEIVDRLTDLGRDVSESLTPIELAQHTDRALMPLAVSYASTVYGGRTGQARDSDLYGVEWWIDRTFDTRARARAAMSLRSLLRRN